MRRAFNHLWILLLGLGIAVPARAFQAVPSSQQQPSNTPEDQDVPQAQEQAQEEEAPEGELAPAILVMDVSGASPLIQALYAATRDTKVQPTLDHLAQAKAMIDGGADLKATDALGRTALHWAIFGSSYATSPKLIVAYEELARDLIQHGIEINHEDVYQDTALDYLLYSPNFEMQTLLIENNATSGFLAASFNFIDQLDACTTPGGGSSIGRSSVKPVSSGHAFAPQASIAQDPSAGAPGESSSASGGQAARIAAFMNGDLSPGETISIRLITPVYSDRSRTGDPIEGIVTYPLCAGGEQIACKSGELLLAPGTKVNGTVLFAQKAPDKYWRPRLVLDFSNIVYPDGRSSPLYSRVIDVDNARETIRNNEILGIIQPHASTKVSLAMTAAGAATPVAGITIKAIQAIYGLSIRREVLFPAGTDVQVQIVRPSMLRERESWPGWPTLSLTPQLQKIVLHEPIRTYTKGGTPSDLTNLLFLGTREQIRSAFLEAGWYEADPLSMGSAIKTATATMRQAGYSTAPVSSLTINGRLPDLVFQKSLDTFAKRHHIRIWKMAGTYEGKEIWVGAATHDIAVSNARAGTKWSHRIDPHVDRERDWAETDLLFAGTANGYVDVYRPAAPRITSNATGDEIVTDGIITVVKVGPANISPPTGTVPTLQTRQ